MSQTHAGDLIHAFDTSPATEAGDPALLLGGKGAGLARMRAIGLPVPPGFTIPTPVCRRVLAEGWFDELDAAIAAGVAALEAELGRRLGDPDDPLLVSVRSGAPVSMPGMMDTVLNVGMSAAAAGALGGEQRRRAFRLGHLPPLRGGLRLDRGRGAGPRAGGAGPGRHRRSSLGRAGGRGAGRGRAGLAGGAGRSRPSRARRPRWSRSRGR